MFKLNKKLLIKRILELQELQEKPPVVIDIGASGYIHSEWEDIAEYCICIAFDADDRELSYLPEMNKKF